MERKDFPHRNKINTGFHLVRHFKALYENDFCLVRDDKPYRNLASSAETSTISDGPLDPLAWYALPSNDQLSINRIKLSQLLDLRVPRVLHRNEPCTDLPQGT